MPSICSIFDLDGITAQSIEVSEETLRRVDAEAVVCLDQVDERDFKKLLLELKEMKVGHTWKKFPILDIGNYYNIQTEENKKRETKFFFYYAVKQGQLDFLGAATIALKIKNDLAFDGFPVISRCFIMEKYRQNRFYSPILKHRIQYCEESFGEDLKAIHMGTSNIRVLKAALNDSFMKFKFIGCENLDCGKYKEVVYDFLKFSPQYLAKLNNGIKTVDKELHSYIQKIINLEYSSNDFKRLKVLLDKNRVQNPIIDELTHLIEAIGVVHKDEDIRVIQLAETKFNSRTG